MARTRLDHSPSLLDQVCDRLSWRSRRPQTRGTHRHSPLLSRALGFECCEPRNMLAGGSIGGIKFDDPTGGGFGPGDTPLGGVTINFYKDNGSNTFNPGDPLVDTQVTAAGTGIYDFTNLADGRYYVQEVAPAGSVQTGGPPFYTVDVIDGATFSATTMTVDDFDVPNPADNYFINALNPNPTLLKESGPTTDIIGGFRDVLINVLGSPNPISAEGFVGMSGGKGTFNLGTAASAPGSEATLQYSGSGSDMVSGGNLTNAMALTNTDLTDGGVNNGLRFDFDFLQSPSGSVGETITATSAGGTATFTGSIPQNAGAFSAFVPFSSFSTTGSFTFTDITSLKIDFNAAGTPDVDFELNRIDTADQTNIGFNFANFTPPNLSITKVDNAGGSSITNTIGNVLPGQSLTYTVVVTNSGPGNATGVQITDPFPGVFTNDTFTATQTGGASGFSASGSGNINDLSVNMPAGSIITYVVTGTVSAAATGTMTNVATVTPPTGPPDTATDIDNLPNLSITKVDNAGGSSITNTIGNVLPGQSLTYTIVVTNSGPGFVNNAQITDPFPGVFTNDTFTATQTGGASGFSTSGSGNINDLSVNMPAGSTITYVVTGTVSAAATGTMTNVATVTPPAGPPKTATDIDNLPNLSITKVDNAGGSSITNTKGNVLPGQLLTYTIVVTNSGPGFVNNAQITDPFPGVFTNDTFTATQTGGASGFSTSGSGNINDLSVNMPAGSTITYVVTGTVSAAATGTMTNVATVTPPAGPPKTATDIDNLPNLSITKVDNAGGSSITNTIGNVLPGQSLTYTIVVTNSGPGFVNNAQITDPFPGVFTNDTFTATQTGGASGFSTSGSGNINDLSVNMPAGSTITYVVTGTVSAAATGTMTNVATVTPPAGPPKTATDIDNLPNLSITKVDNAGGSSITNTKGNVLPGQLLTYTIVVTNSGPGFVNNAQITDPFPGVFTNDTFTATQTGGASGFSTSGSGNINDLSVNMPAGSTITYVVTGTVSAAATGTMTNVATVTPPTGPPKTATDIDNLPNLSITKVDNAGGSSITNTQGSVVPGQSLTYTIVVTNAGPGFVNNAQITDPFPAFFTNDTFTATQTGGASGFSASGSGNINDLSVNMPAGSTITYVVTGTVSAAATGSLTNVATVTPPAGPPKTATDIDNLTPTIASLSGFVYVDTNNNGTKDSGEPPIAGVNVKLTGTATGGGLVSLTTTTDSLGAYSFSNLAPGNYTITETQPTNFIDGKDAVGSQNSGTIVQTTLTNAIQNITLNGGVNGVHNDFGNLGLTPPFVSKRQFLFPVESVNLAAVQSLSGYAYSETTAGSPVFDPANPAAGESPLAGVTITLTGTGGTQTTTTGAGGAYSFTNLAAGTYTLTETTPSGFTAQTAFVGSQGTGTAGTGVISSITMLATTSGTNNDFPNLSSGAKLSVTKVDNAGGSSITGSVGSVTPGQSLTYTVVASNTGTATATGVTIADPLPANFTSGSWTASTIGGASGFSASGTGNIDDTSVTLPAGSTVTYVVTGTVSSAATGTLVNVATVTPTTGTAQTATDTDNLANLSITKVDNVGGSSITGAVGNATPDDSITYTVVVSNTGTANITGATITDPLPAQIDSDTWTAVATNGASGFSTSGSGNINDTNVSLPAGSKITYTITANIDDEATGTLVNVATVKPAVGTTQSATDTDTLQVEDSAQPAAIPGTNNSAPSNSGTNNSGSNAATQLSAAAVDAALAGSNIAAPTKTATITNGSPALNDAALLSFKGSLLGNPA